MNLPSFRSVLFDAADSRYQPNSIETENSLNITIHWFLFFFLTHDVISCTLWFFGFDLELQEINFLVHSCICYKKADESILLLVYSLSCVMIRVSLNSKYRDNSQKWQLFGHFQLLCQEANQFHNLIWLETTKLLFLCMWQSLNSLNREKKIELNAEGVKYKLKVLEESTKWNFNVSIHFSQL